MLSLEQKVNELHAMFEEFAVLLSGQAELLNNIEKNLEGANDYLEDADVQLTKARETHEDGQK